MAQQTMYPGQANSPETELSAGITNVQTTIPVANAAKLPAAPNLVVIGAGETAETILYTGISGNTLTGATRGFQGTAQNWVTGSKVARYFTAYDYAAMKGNIEDHESRISLLAPLSSPSFTGDPKAPTPAVDDNDTSIATTAFFIGQASSTAPIVDGTASVGTSQRYARADHVHPTDPTRLAATAYTASDVLTKIKTVDGLGSGLDTDFVRGRDLTDETTHSNAAGLVSGMRWRNFGNGHRVVDISDNTFPGGRDNSQTPWQPSYPTLVGYNGSQTFGVRVDSARTADQVGGIQFRLNNGNVEFYNGGGWQAMGDMQVGRLREATANAATANTYVTVVNVVGMGRLELATAYIQGGYTGTVRVTIDGVAESMTFTNGNSEYRSFSYLGTKFKSDSSSADQYTQTQTPINFYQSLKVEFSTTFHSELGRHPTG